MGRPEPLSPSTTWPSGRREFWLITKSSSWAAESGSAISTRRTSRTDGTLASCMRKARSGMGATIRGLASLAPRTLALMHGPSYAGDGAVALRALADDYDRRVRQMTV